MEQGQKAQKQTLAPMVNSFITKEANYTMEKRQFL